VQRPGQGDRLGGEVAAGGLAAGAGQVALVEDEVHDGEDLGQPAGQLVRVGDGDRRVETGEGLACPEDALRHRRLADQERRRDLVGRQAADGTQGERDLGVAG
jgi:hypothetical protein